MKRTIALLLILAIGVATLAGCGGTPTPSTALTSAATSSPTPAPTTAPTPTPNPVTTVTVTHEQFGGMSLSFPGDKNYAVIESADTLEVTAFMEAPEFKNYIRDHLNAHIVGDGFEVAMGFMDRSEMSIDTYQRLFDTEKERERFNQFTEIQIGNEAGFVVNVRGIACFVFPGLKEMSIRTIAVFTDETKEKGSSLDKDTIPSILENPDIKALLDTLVLIGNVPGAGTSDEPTDTTPAAETIEDSYITFTVKDGWYVAEKIPNGFDGEHDYKIQYQGNSFNEISIKLNKHITLKELTDGLVSSLKAEVMDDITINSVQFHVLQQSGGTIWLTTSAGAFDDQKKGAFSIHLFGYKSIDEVLPFLETISVSELK